MTRREDALALARRLDAWGSERAWRGTDPYEGLNARRFAEPLRRSAIGRRILIQAVKRSPLDLRPMMGIEPAVSSASLAWVASAYARATFLERDDADRKLNRTLGELERLRCPGFSEPCWGYHFDFQSRVFFYPSSQPNTIATSFAGLALLDAYEQLGDPELLARAARVGRFFLERMSQTVDPPGAYFGYVPGDRSPIHNANMLACALLARLSRVADDGGDLRDAAGEGLRYTLERQRPDGSWPYGERPNLAWVDNFHTGYVLDALHGCMEAGLGDDRTEEAWKAGLSYYRRELFLGDGTPKYYATGVYPIDAQCVAQAIQTFSIASRHEPSYTADAWRVFSFAKSRMVDADGLPIFQRRRLWSNRARHVRWVIAPMLLALSHLLTEDPGGGGQELGAYPTRSVRQARSE